MSIFSETNIDELTEDYIRKYGDLQYRIPYSFYGPYCDCLIKCITIKDEKYWKLDGVYKSDLSIASLYIGQEIRQTKKKFGDVLSNISSLDLQNIYIRYHKYVLEKNPSKLMFENKEYIQVDWADKERIRLIMRYMINLPHCYKYIKQIPSI